MIETFLNFGNWSSMGSAFLSFLSSNLEVVILSSLIFIQWMALQAFAIHYYFFRRSVRRKRPEGLRIATLEKLVSFQSEQIERLYGQLADQKKELRDFMRERVSLVEEKKSAGQAPTHSMDSGYVSLGELNLKKKLEAMRSSAGRAN